MNKQLSLIILTYNSEKDIYDCLTSVYKYNDIGEELEIIVVDNNSANFETMHSKLQELYPDVIVIKNEKNGGYGQGNNVGIRASSAPIVAVMNPDVRLIMPVFGTFIKALSSPNVVMCGGKQYLENQKTTLSYDCDIASSVFYQTICYPILRRLYIFDSKKMWLSGAFFAIKKDVIIQIGLFDENIFMYCEENDIMRRLQNKYSTNSKTLFLPTIHYIHCVTERPFSPKVVERQFISQCYLCQKYDIPIESFIKSQKKIMSLQRLLFFLRNGKFKDSQYQTCRLELFEKTQNGCC